VSQKEQSWYLPWALLHPAASAPTRSCCHSSRLTRRGASGLEQSARSEARAGRVQLAKQDKLRARNSCHWLPDKLVPQQTRGCKSKGLWLETELLQFLTLHLANHIVKSTTKTAWLKSLNLTSFAKVMKHKYVLFVQSLFPRVYRMELYSFHSKLINCRKGVNCSGHTLPSSRISENEIYIQIQCS
jgi:hypothetical protein